MSKSIISLILSDDTITRIDRECVQAGKSRSQFVDDLLASHYGIDLPSLRFSEIVNRMTEAMTYAGSISLLQDTAHDTVEYRTTLSYRYQPKVFFQIHFQIHGKVLEATLRITTRTTSRVLWSLLEDLFARLDEMEPRLGTVLPGGPTVVEGNRLIRKYGFHKENTTSHQVAEELMKVCQWIQDALEIYFEKDMPGLGFEEALVEKYGRR